MSARGIGIDRILSVLGGARTARTQQEGIGQVLQTFGRDIRVGQAGVQKSKRALAEANKDAAAASNWTNSVGGYAAKGMMAAGLGFGANTLLSGIQETFGDRMSSGANFALSAAKFGATIGAGVFTATNLGRAGLVAKAKFSSKNPLMQKAYAPMMKSGGSRGSWQRTRALEAGSKEGAYSHLAGGARRTRTQEGASNAAAGAIEKEFRTGSRFGERGSVRRLMKESRRTLSGKTKGKEMRGKLNKANKLAGEQSATTAVQLGRTNLSTSQRLLRRQRTLNSSRAQAFKDINKAEGMFKQVAGYRSAQSFSAGKMLLGVGKMPFAMAGGMLGRGSLWGKIDPGMQFTGKAMAYGSGAGIAAGMGIGIHAMSSRRLGANQGPAQRQTGRSFSNISYNATLHSHRMGG